MKRARLHRRHSEVRQPRSQLGRRPSGEGHREHVPGLNFAGEDPERDPVCDGAGLARAGTGEDAHATGGRGHGGPLLLVEPGEHRFGLG